MEIISEWLVAYFDIIAVMLILSYCLGIIVFILIISRLNRLSKQYKKLMRGADGKNIEEIVFAQTKTVEEAQDKIALFNSRLSELDKYTQQSVQKVELIRFNAFQDVGGDLSFAVALLNAKNDGIVISSIYGRDDARTYAKTIKNGQPLYPLSKEEEKVLEMAINKI